MRRSSGTRRAGSCPANRLRAAVLGSSKPLLLRRVKPLRPSPSRRPKSPRMKKCRFKPRLLIRAATEFVEETLFEEVEEFTASEGDEFTRPGAGAGPPVLDSDEEELEEELVEEATDLSPANSEAEFEYQEETEEAPATTSPEANSEEGKNGDGAEPEGDAFASHKNKIRTHRTSDSSASAKRRKRKKQNRSLPRCPPSLPLRQDTGLVEEELIDGEEFDASPRPRQHKPGAHEQRRPGGKDTPEAPAHSRAGAI